MRPTDLEPDVPVSEEIANVAGCLRHVDVNDLYMTHAIVARPEPSKVME